MENLAVFNAREIKRAAEERKREDIPLHNASLGSNQPFGESKDTLNSRGHVKQGEKNMLHNA